MIVAIGLPRKTVRVVAYDSTWPTHYESEALLIRIALGVATFDLAQIGSTAVPGLEAKPIIDIMLAITSLRAPETIFTILARLGYEHRPYDDLSDRLFFAKTVDTLRTHNLSVCEMNSDFWHRRIRFRDCLRPNDELARLYGQLKRELAATHPSDRVAYTNGKKEFIANALESSRRVA